MVGFDKLFEISFEICNKVGGIYTVISSKANLFVKNYSEKYVAVGPYYKQNNVLEFLEKEIPIEFKEINDSLLKKGIIIHYGIWGIKGKPQTILIETNEKYKRNLNDLKIKYWNDYSLDSLNSGYDFDEPLIWASAVGEFVKEYANKNKNHEIVAHAHEWLSGFSIMQLKGTKNVKTIFTTHATMLGRTLCSHGYNIYNEIEKYNPIELAYKYNIQSKFLTEKICANISDCFTTVSKITGIETKFFFGKEPDVITENGLDSDNYYDSQENVVKQLEASSMLREFISYYFTPYYLLDSSKSIILFISGRYEFKNKGMDLFIRALGKLNEKLKELNFKKNVVVFFWVPRDVKNINNSLLYQKSKYRHFKTLIDRNIEDIKEKIMSNIMQNKPINENLIEEELSDNIRKSKIRYFLEGNPPLSSYDFNDFFEDSTIKSLIDNGLTNKKEDVVKVIDYPVYLNGDDGLLNLSYEEAVLGSDLGIFPSYYEPWGYTPLENAMMGIPALTCDVCGYGDYISALKEFDNKGVLLLKRKNKSQEEISDNLYSMLLKFVKLDNKSIIEQKIKAKRLSEYTDWKILYKKYEIAYEFALKNVKDKK